MDSDHHELTVGSTRNSDLLGRVNTPRAVCTPSDRMTPSLLGRVADPFFHMENEISRFRLLVHLCLLPSDREGDEISVISPFPKLAHQQQVVLPAFSQVLDSCQSWCSLVEARRAPFQ
ncbi:hypothetical protein T08_3912 [Trichinella sp. T8]|nr:hypothetical protein T08_3912 [Trichinella sp. T8]